jgi:RNA polymerase II C-terminal domain phosphatase-like 3/4
MQVWPRHRQNLIQVERYHFFPASIRQFNSDAKSLLEMGKDESATNGTLATCLAVLKDVHAQ